MSEPLSAPILRVRDLHKVFGKSLFKKKGFPALCGVDLEVGRGQVFGLLGPNGAGKTTLIKILLGLTRGWSGEAEIFGRRPLDPLSRQKVGFLPEAHQLPPYLTGRQVMHLFGMMAGADSDVVKARIDPLFAGAHANRGAALTALKSAPGPRRAWSRNPILSHLSSCIYRQHAPSHLRS